MSPRDPPPKAELLAGVHELAATIAAKSPVAIYGTKQLLLHARDSTVAEGLDYTATWSSGVLVGDDLQRAVSAAASKAAPEFADLNLKF